LGILVSSLIFSKFKLETLKNTFSYFLPN